jgi:hypothetical protein
MIVKRTASAAALAAALCLPGLPAHAVLVDRGGGMLYDNVLNVTWLQDANYIRTSGFHPSGALSWQQASEWIGNLAFGGYTDWRLPQTRPLSGNQAFDFNTSNDGSTDVGFNITSPQSELAYMYYVNLGLKGALSRSGAPQPDFGIFGDGSVGGTGDVGLVRNLVSTHYWYGTQVAGPTVCCASFTFRTNNGFQEVASQGAIFYSWAVRDGDVTPVPVPGSAMLMLSALAGFALLRRKSWDAKVLTPTPA